MTQEYLEMDKNTIKAVVDALIEDLSGRKGLGNEWENCDEEVQAESKKEWCDIIMKTLNQHN
jgi:hypothetical protein